MSSCTESEADSLFGLCGLVLATWVNLECKCAKLKPAVESVDDEKVGILLIFRT